MNDKLLGGYNVISISLIDMKDLINGEISDANHALFAFMNRFGIDEGTLNSIYITHGGITFILTRIVDIIADRFGVINDQNIVDRVDDEISKWEKCNNEMPFNNSTKKLFADFCERYHYFTSKKKKEKFRQELIEELGMFKHLLTNRDDYASVDINIFDRDKLGLYVATNVMRYTKRCLDNKKYKEYRIGIHYLLEYVKDNDDLVGNEFTFKMRESKPDERELSVVDVYKYVLGFIIPLKEKKEDSDSLVEEFDYSFFEQKGEECTSYMKRLLDAIKSAPSQEELKALLMRKISFYLSLKIEKIKVGRESFAGYIGFVLPQGIVVLDKLFENVKTETIAHDNAIYIVSEDDFEFITRMTKTETIKSISCGAIKAKRVIHREDFENEVLGIISKNANL